MSNEFKTWAYQQSRGDSTANRVQGVVVYHSKNGVQIEFLNTKEKVVDTILMDEAEFTRFCLNLISLKECSDG